VSRERLFDCEYFRLWRLRGHSPLVSAPRGVPRVLICSEGAGQMERCGTTYAVGKAKYGSCRRRSERVPFSPAVQ